MPFRKVFFKKGQPFHIVSRAVEERKIFEKKEDCYRFVLQVFAANVGKPAPNLRRKDVIKAAKTLFEGREVPSEIVIVEHPPLVHIFDFALVMNHYHFCLAANVENGIPLFIKKLNGGFAMYFNLKYGRKGALFGGRYKSIPIETEFQLAAVNRYINIINPLDVYQPGWREIGLRDWREPLDFLKNYQFSSFLDKIGKRNSRILAPKEILERWGKGFSIDEKEYFQFAKDFLRGKLSSFGPFFLE